MALFWTVLLHETLEFRLKIKMESVMAEVPHYQLKLELDVKIKFLSLISLGMNIRS